MVKKIRIVSLSSGILGEPFIEHERKIGLTRLVLGYGMKVEFSNHALCGEKYLRTHPQKRADDLLEAFRDQSVDMILCAIGGDDTYRLLPYLFEHNELKKAVCQKIFLGFSDTTVNHLMLHKLGIRTFYGQAFLPDICEFSEEMLPYTRAYFEELIQTGKISEITPSDVWYDERTEWGAEQIGTSMPIHANNGFELLQGNSRFEGKILGGCVESLYDILASEVYPACVKLCQKYELFPSMEDWKGRILLLETSELKPTPKEYEKMLLTLKNTGIFEVVNGVLMDKPQDETYFEEYKKILTEVIDDFNLPIVANINVGHSTPRCIVPFGVHSIVDVDKQKIIFQYDK